MPITRRALGKTRAASSIQSLLARLPWMKTTVTSPSPHSRQPRWTSPARSLATRPLLLVEPGGRRGTGRWSRRDADGDVAGRAIDQTVDGNRRVDHDIAELHEVDYIGRELHRVVGVDEVTRVGIDLHDRPIAGDRHALG